MLTGGLAPIADVAMERFFSPEFRHHRPETVTRFRQALLDTSAAGYAGCCAALRDADLTLDVNRIEIPTLVIAGLRDVSTTPAQLRALAAAITGSQLAELDAAHLSNVERPEEFSRMVGSFFLARGTLEIALDAGPVAFRPAEHGTPDLIGVEQEPSRSVTSRRSAFTVAPIEVRNHSVADRPSVSMSLIATASRGAPVLPPAPDRYLIRLR